jgi:predicted unusual protein kinase regulating ubiquinone biosynthesis (AarF/ABC1/UbiB family)
VKLPRFIPAELRELASFVPASGWDAIEWRPLLAGMRAISVQLVTGRGVDALSERLAAQTQAVQTVDSLDGATPLEKLRGGARRQGFGDDLLELYFSQWLLEEGLFLDLRPSRFAARGDRLLFQPNGLWVTLRPDFREGMLALYRSFYSGDDAAFNAALRQMGMLRDDLDESAASELKGLLRQHFGMDQRRQRFKIEGFRASFDELFRFFLEHDYRLHSDFVFVGFYLITLYLSLEALGEAHDTRAICARVLD